MDVKEHTCDVVEIHLEPHPNADSLSLVYIGDFQCVVRTDEWKDGDLAIYVEPDSVVPDTDQFKFLNGSPRIKARKLRGEWSVGLLIKAPDGAKLGDDYMEQLGVTHYEPQTTGGCGSGGEKTSAPPIIAPVYDVLNFRKYSSRFVEGEEVCVTEKLHGTNSRFTCVDDKMYCGSRRNWKRQDENNLWWKALARNPALDAWLRHHQGFVVYGEIFGQVQNLKYGAIRDQIFFAAFDILDQNGHWLNFDEARKMGSPLPWVPLVYRGLFDKTKILELAEGDSSYSGANHHREGVVLKPVKERTDKHIGRVQLKVVGNKYLGKS